MSETARQDLLGAIEGYYLVCALDGLHRTGALTALRCGKPVEQVARDCGLDVAMLSALVVYLQRRMRGALEVQLSDGALPLDEAFIGHLLDQYVGAFGPCLSHLPELLTTPAAGARRVDWKRHAEAFAQADRGSANTVPLSLLAQLGVQRVLDIGCGAGGLLLDLAEQDPEMRAWGIDANAAAVAASASAARAAGVDDRVRFYVGDAFCAAQCLPPDVLDEVQVVTAFNVANAFFAGSGGNRIDAWLRELRQAFAQRFLLLGDYYGRLGLAHDPSSHRYRRTLFHDLAQVATGQGVPPADIDEWRLVLETAGCCLVKAFEGEHDEVAHFVYLIQL